MDERRNIDAGWQGPIGLRTAIPVSLAAAAVLGAGLTGARLVMGERAVPPWIEAALYALIAGVAVLTVFAVLRHERVHWPQRHAAGDPYGDESTGASVTAERAELFQVDERDGRRLLRAADVRWIEAEGNYARMHTRDGAFLYRQPLARLEERLASSRFVRVHRSALVNLEAVQRITPFASGDAQLQLDSGRTVRLSRRYARAFHERTGRAG